MRPKTYKLLRYCRHFFLPNLKTCKMSEKWPISIDSLIIIKEIYVNISGLCVMKQGFNTISIINLCQNVPETMARTVFLQKIMSSINKEYVASLMGLYKDNGADSCITINFLFI